MENDVFLQDIVTPERGITLLKNMYLLKTYIGKKSFSKMLEVRSVAKRTGNDRNHFPAIVEALRRKEQET